MKKKKKLRKKGCPTRPKKIQVDFYEGFLTVRTGHVLGKIGFKCLILKHQSGCTKGKNRFSKDFA